MLIKTTKETKKIELKIGEETIGIEFRTMTLGDKMSYLSELSDEKDNVKMAGAILDKLFIGFIGKLEIEEDGKTRKADKFSDILLSDSLSLAPLVNEAMMWAITQIVGNEKKSK